MAWTREQIEALKVGDVIEVSMIGNGNWKRRRIVSITTVNTDVHGKTFIHFYTDLGDGASVSGSIKEGRELDADYYRLPEAA